MPRDISGNYTLPPVNPVAPQTIIDVAWANPTMADLAAAMTDSLSRSGNGGMLVAFKNADGVQANPGITWVNEPTSGWYRNGVGDFWYAIGNQNIFRITANGVELSPGKSAIGFVSAIVIQDAEPVVKIGQQWFESDTGALYMRYQNPDLSFVWIQVNPIIGGNYLPATGLNTVLGDFATDAAAAAGGVAIGGPYRTGNAMKVRIV